jgi:hypothetical protein
VQESNDVVAYCFEGAHDGAIADGPCWTDEGKEVGHIRDAEAEVAVWCSGPFLSEVDAVAADDGEVGAEAGVEACSADDGVDLLLRALRADDGLLCDLNDFFEMYVHVRLLNSFHVGITWSNAAWELRISLWFVGGVGVQWEHTGSPLQT